MTTYQIASYKVMFYGTKEGYGNARGQLMCYDAKGTLRALIRFHDAHQTFPADTEAGGKITMNLPSEQFVTVVDVLRNEKPLYIYFAQNRGFLTTSKEETGEEET